MIVGQLLVKKGNKVKPLKIIAGVYNPIDRGWLPFGFSLDGTANMVVTEGEVSEAGTAKIRDCDKEKLFKYLPKIKIV